MSQDAGEGFQQVKVCQVRVAEMQRPQKKGTSASKYGKTGLRDTEEGLQRTKYVKAGNSASKYVKTGLRRQQKAQGRVLARQSTSNQGCGASQNTKEGFQHVKVLQIRVSSMLGFTC